MREFCVAPENQQHVLERVTASRAMPPAVDGGALALAWLALGLVAANLALRVVVVALTAPPRRPADGPPLRTLVVLGSGGHTAEMFALLRALPPSRYAPRSYVLADTDSTSAAKVDAHEAAIGATLALDDTVDDAKLELVSDHCLIRTPRSREVGQNYVTAAFTTARATIHAFGVVWREAPDVVLTNGPGTCLPICLAAFALRVLGARGVAPLVVYAESVCRVRKLSLTGEILYRLRIADALLVQWEGLVAKYPRAKYAGRVM